MTNIKRFSVGVYKKLTIRLFLSAFFLMVSVLCCVSLPSIGCASPIESADSCSPIDFSEQLGPIRDQGNTGWCEFFVAADLITNFTDGKVRVSALDVAWTVKALDLNKLRITLQELIPKNLTSEDRQKALDFWYNFISTRNLTEGLSLADRMQKGASFVDISIDIYNINHGACSESRLPSGSAAPSNSSVAFKKMGGYLGDEVENLSKGKSNASLGQLLDSSAFFTFPGEPNQSYIQSNLSKIAAQNNDLVAKNVKNAIDRACSPRVPIGRMIAVGQYSASMEKNLAYIDSNLQNGRIVGIDVNGCKLQDQSLEDTSIMRKIPADCEHEVSLVGRRWNFATNRCEYKIRNSWGQLPANWYVARLQSKFENGYLYLNSDDLAWLQIYELSAVQKVD